MTPLLARLFILAALGAGLGVSFAVGATSWHGMAFTFGFLILMVAVLLEVEVHIERVTLAACRQATLEERVRGELRTSTAVARLELEHDREKRQRMRPSSGQFPMLPRGQG